MNIPKLTEITQDHIGIFDNFFDENLCENYINFYKQLEKINCVSDRSNKCPQHIADDKSFALITTNFYRPEYNLDYISKDFIDIFFRECYSNYVKQYSILNECGRHGILDIKIQKTCPGQGYHAWHIENNSMHSRNRLCAFMLYLNDVEEGGETEFLYQRKRFKPIKNRLLIWPAMFTHLHRGNPPLSGDKYIITGWVEYMV